MRTGHRYAVLLLWATAALGLTLPAQAQEAEPARTQRTIFVTADRMKEDLSRVSQNVTVIGKEEIERSTGDNVADLLKRHGIQTYHENSAAYGNQGVVMRGGKSSMHGFDLAGDVLFLVDGRRVGSDNFAVMGLNNVERIEVIRGPGAVQYGAAAIGGVINVITKRGGEKPEAILEAGIGSFGKQVYKGFASGRAGKFDVAGWASYTTIDDYTDGNGDTVENTAVDYLTKFGFNAGYNFNDRNRLGISFNGMDGHKMEAGEFGSSSYRNQYQNRDYYLGEILYEGATSDDSLSWLARYWFGRTTYELNRELIKSGQRGNYSDNTQDIQGAQAQLSWVSDRFSLTGGVDMLYYDMEQNQPLSIFTTSKKASYSTSDYFNVGTFLLGKLYLLEDKNLTLSAGIRYDYFKVNVDSEYGIPPSDILDNETKEDSFIPSLGIVYSPWEFLKLRANYSEAFRMPTPRDLGGIYVMGRSTFYGNANLKPEKSRTWDIGFDVDYDSMHTSFTFFDTRYRDKIEATPAVNNQRYWVNIASAHIQGIEAAFRYDIGQAFMLPFTLEPYISLTHLITFEDGEHLYLENVARNSFSWGLIYDQPSLGLSASLDFTYYDRQCLDAEKGEWGPGGSTVVDFSLTKSIKTFDNGGDLKLKFLVENLFDKYYSTNGEYYMPGRAFYMALQYTY